MHDTQTVYDGEDDEYIAEQLVQLVDDSERIGFKHEFRAYVHLPNCLDENLTDFVSPAFRRDAWSCNAARTVMIFVSCIVTLGLAGNTATISRYGYGRRKQSSFATHVRYLALTDICTLCVVLLDLVFHCCESCGSTVSESFAVPLSYGHVAIWYLNNVLMTSRHYQTFYFATDRYLAVRDPFHHQTQSGVRRRIGVIVGVIFAFSAAIAAPIALRFQTYICLDTATFLLLPTRLRFLRVYGPVMTLLIQFTVPLVGSLAMTALLHGVSNKHLRRRPSLRAHFGSSRTVVAPEPDEPSDPDSQEYAFQENEVGVTPQVATKPQGRLNVNVERMQRLNRSVILLVVIFVVCELPILVYFYVTVSFHSPSRSLLLMLAGAMSAIDSSVNFFAYQATKKSKSFCSSARRDV